MSMNKTTSNNGKRFTQGIMTDANGSAGVILDNNQPMTVDDVVSYMNGVEDAIDVLNDLVHLAENEQDLLDAHSKFLETYEAIEIEYMDNYVNALDLGAPDSGDGNDGNK